MVSCLENLNVRLCRVKQTYAVRIKLITINIIITITRVLLTFRPPLFVTRFAVVSRIAARSPS